jgi:DNA-binding FadR family transcriptional regulator
VDGDDAYVESDSAPLRPARVRRVRSFEDVVEQVRASIASGSIGVGERLPSERELAEQFGVSRATLREALRALEAMGMLEIRLGARGGAFATSPDDERFASAVSDLFGTHGGTRPEEFRELRASFHADNAYWAGSRGLELKNVSDSVDEGESTFLIALAHATANPFRAVLASSIERTRARSSGYREVDRESLRGVVDILAQGDVGRARDALYRLLSNDAERRPLP